MTAVTVAAFEIAALIERVVEFGATSLCHEKNIPIIRLTNIAFNNQRNAVSSGREAFVDVRFSLPTCRHEIMFFRRILPDAMPMNFGPLHL
ncbi:MAG: hypothetical protein EOQ46_26430 [Mesorhizobium sp.]|uniref:hypothetical protein n=1 Tax=Mesorhizobium sp. TaxID=1871066 RepID=UPI000FE838C3|nr:hypothetical protein [Mesorhizobium sp.]RWB39771.1 MAG: hypothetical protein EOQ46_26430 [Mesorhizobium sp.]